MNTLIKPALAWSFSQNLSKVNNFTVMLQWIAAQRLSNIDKNYVINGTATMIMTDCVWSFILSFEHVARPPWRQLMQWYIHVAIEVSLWSSVGYADSTDQTSKVLCILLWKFSWRLSFQVQFRPASSESPSTHFAVIVQMAPKIGASCFVPVKSWSKQRRLMFGIEGRLCFRESCRETSKKRTRVMF